MILDLFIRTYPKDFAWLNYALKSIHKYVTGYRNIIVCSPDISGLQHLTAEKVFRCDDLPDGYVGQQYTKLNAWRYTDADFITYWDSDVVATEPIYVWTEYFQSGLSNECSGLDEMVTQYPIIWKTPYSVLPREAQIWQPVVEKWLGFKPEYEYMRRMPLTYHRDTVQECWSYLGGLRLGEYMRQAPHREFTEFNILGAYAEAYDHEDYIFKDTEVEAPPPNKVVQSWSWGGMTPDVMAVFEKADLL
jgi:hypothetical protein